MNCSGKFLVPIVMGGPGRFPVVFEPESSPPQPAAVTASATTAAAATAACLMRRISGDGPVVGRRRSVARAGLDRQREPERAALARLRLGPDPAAVVLDDPLADRQADARARVGALAVQAME